MPISVPVSTDFNHESYMRNCITFISSNSESNPLQHSPNGDKTGHWILKGEVFGARPDSQYRVLQTATSFASASISGGHSETYYRYWLINTDGNIDSVSNRWHKLETSSSTSITKDSILDLLKQDYTDAPASWEQLTPTRETTKGAYVRPWITDYNYSAGFIKTVKIQILGDDDQSGALYFINASDGTIINIIKFSGHGDLIIDVNEYFNSNFYLGIDAQYANFSTIAEIKFIHSNSSLDKSSIVDLSGFDYADGTTNGYCLAQEITYGNLYDVFIDSNKDYSKSLNKLYVIGDSITAGHNSYMIGNHWWEAIAREYGYKVKLGARTGAGMSYYNGTNAPKIVTQQDLSDYDVILIAFGTNDYGNNQELGTINDSYEYKLDSSQTFYAALKYTIETIKSKNPMCTIIFSLPINRTTAFGGTTGDINTKYAYGYQNSLGYTLNDYCEAIIQVCNYYGLPYIDHRNGAYDVFAIANGLLYDGLHPSEYGYKVLGCEMIAKFGSIIRPYPEYDGSGGPNVKNNQY